MLLRRQTCTTQSSRSFSIAAPAFPFAAAGATTGTPSSTNTTNISRRRIRPVSPPFTHLDEASTSQLIPVSAASSIVNSTAADPAIWCSLIDSSAHPTKPLSVPRTGVHRDAGFFTSRPTGFFSGMRSNRRFYSTGPADSAASSSSNPNRPLSESSLFKNWDNLIKDLPPPTYIPTQQRPYPNPHKQRQTMTRREMDAFNDMFQLLFSAMEDHSQTAVGKGREVSTAKKRGTDLDSLFGKLKAHSRLMRNEVALQDPDIADEVDRKHEEMNALSSDEELLRWSMASVFPHVSSNTTASAYPYVLAAVMRAFRERYNDPHLALAVFSFARHLSVTSYAFGCTTAAYNELLKTRWDGFKDLRAVLDGLEEMEVNGIRADGETRRIVEGIRSELATGASPEALTLVNQMERLLSRTAQTDRHAKDFKTGQDMEIRSRTSDNWSRNIKKPKKEKLDGWKLELDDDTDIAKEMRLGEMWDKRAQNLDTGRALPPNVFHNPSAHTDDVRSSRKTHPEWNAPYTDELDDDDDMAEYDAPDVDAYPQLSAQFPEFQQLAPKPDSSHPRREGRGDFPDVEIALGPGVNVLRESDGWGRPTGDENEGDLPYH